MFKKLLFSSLFIVLLASQSPAANWNESLNGDLSGNGAVPTPVVFGLGINTISGTMGGDPGEGIPLDRDVFSFTLGVGLQISSIHFTIFSPTGASFYAVAPGNSINFTNASGHLVNTLVKVPGDILPHMVNLQDLQAGGTWGALPVQNRILGSGTYTFWLQEVSSVVTYSTDYTVTAVPEASTYGFFAVAGLGAYCLFKRRRIVG